MNDHLEALTKEKAEFEAIRHRIHQHPELGFEEEQTSKLVADLLESWGYEVHRGLAGTGVVGTLRAGDGKKVVGIRADMDALPIVEQGDKPWKSAVEGKFHGCGHDGHTTSLLAAAKRLSETRNFSGTVHLVFQPAEELLYGGRVMLDDGLFDQFPCDAIFAFHNGPGAPTGLFLFREGVSMAASDTVKVHIKGKSSHGAMPEHGIDANVIASHIVVALQTIVSRNVSPLDAAVITVGSIHGGQAPNVVNEETTLQLTVRTLKPEVRDLVIQRMRDVVDLQARSFGASATMEITNSCPSLVNGSEATQFAVRVAQEFAGAEKVVTEMPVMMGSEDFAFMLNAQPNGCYFFLGNGTDCAMLHNPLYDFNDEILPVAAAYWCTLVERYLTSE